MGYPAPYSKDWYKNLIIKQIESQLFFEPAAELAKRIVKKYGIEKTYEAADSIELTGLILKQKFIGIEFVVGKEKITFCHSLNEYGIEEPFLLRRGGIRSYPQDFSWSDKKNLLDGIISRYYQLEKILESDARSRAGI